MKRNALGRGLDSLISVDEIQTSGSSAISDIDINLISPNPDQPRTTFDDVALDELAASIREVGIIQPLTLRKLVDGKYQIISGERRYRAAKKAGLENVPAYIREANDSELTEMALIENIQREDLNPIEEAQAYRRLLDEFDLTQEQVAEQVGKSRSTVANALRLLELPEGVRTLLLTGFLTAGHARALLGLKNKDEIVPTALRAVEITLLDHIVVAEDSFFSFFHK